MERRTVRFWYAMLCTGLLVPGLLPVCDGAAAPDEQQADAPKDRKKDALTWQPLLEGLSAAREARKPVLLVTAGRHRANHWAELETKLLTSRSLIRQLQRFVTVESRDQDAEFLKELLGELEGQPALALLDFRGSILGRWDGDIPERRKFVRHLKLAWARNASLAKNFARAEEEIERARYAVEIKRYRQAVEGAVKARALELPPLSEPVEKLHDLMGQIQDAYEKREAKAEELDQKGDYASAIGEYQKLIHDFPLPEKQKAWRQLITELWRKIYQP